MKSLIIFIFFLSYNIFAKEPDCTITGSAWKGLRKVTGKCEKTKEISHCLKTIHEDSRSTEHPLNICKCNLNEVTFYKKLSKAFEFKTQKTSESKKLFLEKPIEHADYTKRLYQEACFPNKLIEMKKSCTKKERCPTYYAIYEYIEDAKGPNCILKETTSNALSIDEEWYFPGARNTSALITTVFSSAIKLNLKLISKELMEDLETIESMDENAKKGDLNCSGTISEIAEKSLTIPTLSISNKSSAKGDTTSSFSDKKPKSTKH